MSAARQFDRSSYLKLKAATRRLNKQVGGQEAAASLTRVDIGRLCRYGLPHDPSFMPVDVVADLESDAGDLIVTKVLAGLNGHLVVPVPVVCRCTDWIGQLGATGKEAGEAVAALAAAIADGNDGGVTAEAARRANLEKEVREAMEVLAGVLVALQGGEQ